MTVAQREALVREYGRALGLPYPMGLLEMLEEALELYRRNFGVLFGIALVPALLSVLMAIVTDALQRFPAQSPLLIGAFIVVYVAALLSSFWGMGAQTWVVGKALVGETVGFGKAWGAVLRRIIAYTVTVILGFLASMLGMCLFCVGVLFTTTVFFALLEQVIMLEGIGYFRAIERHLQLVYPNWQWARVLGFWLVGYFLVLVVQTLIGSGGMVTIIGVEIAREVLPVSTQVLLVALGNLWAQVASALMMPYFVAFLTLLYFDLRARREGTDLQVLLQRWEGWGAVSGLSG